MFLNLLITLTPMIVALFGCTGDEQTSVSDLIHVVRQGNSIKVRQEACYQLGKKRGVEVVEVLIKCLDDPVLQDCAAQGLGQIKAIRAVDPLLKHLQRDSGLNRMAVWALGELGDSRALRQLKQLSATFVPKNEADQIDKRTLEEVIAKLTRQAR